MKGITEKTIPILEAVSKLEIIQPYTLVGGTALAIQLGTRESEDLDFMSWRVRKGEVREVNWAKIKKELESIGNISKFDLLDLDHVEFVVNDVKLSFYANPNVSPIEREIDFINYIKLADPESIGAMKMEVMLRRSKFRDYYDIYSLIKAGYDINKMVDKALRYSGHRLKSKNLLALLTRSERFIPDENFKSLNPIYQVTSVEIETEIRKALKILKNEQQ